MIDIRANFLYFTKGVHVQLKKQMQSVVIHPSSIYTLS